MHKIYAFLVIGWFLTGANVLSCSNVAITSPHNTIVARTLDFEENTGNVFALGRVGQENFADLNLNRHAKNLSWTNRFAFMGQTGMESSIIIDGFNTAGLYAGYFYLPGITQYPRYHASIHKPGLGVTNVVNYVLGEAASVKQAIALLHKLQIVENALPLQPGIKKTAYAVMPVHILLRDKTGASAVIEFIDGKTVISKNIGPVLTNSPSIKWQQNHARHYNYVRTNNTNKKFGGLHMNGSGFYGIPGDWTPPSRFARAAQVIRHFPQAHNSKQAMSLARQALHVVEVPLGTNPSPTLWESIVNLAAGQYYFRPMLKVIDSKHYMYAVQYHGLNDWKSYNLNEIVKSKQLPAGWILAKLKPGHYVKHVINMLHPKSGPVFPPPNPRFTA